MKYTKMVSLIMSAAFVSFSIPFGGIAAAADASDATVLFSDAFEGYTNASDPFSFYSSGYGKYYSASEVSDNFRLFAGLAGKTYDAAPDGYSDIPVAKELMQLAPASQSGIGTGNSLMVTAQAQASGNQLVKNTAITADEINGKQLVFKTTFKVPAFVGYGDAVAVALADFDTGAATSYSTSTQIYQTADKSSKKGELMYLGARTTSSLTSSTGSYADLGGGTRKNELWTFGEKVADLTADTVYTYTVTMTPDNNGIYNVETDLNGAKYTLKGTDITSTIPTITEMATFSKLRVIRPSHTTYFKVGYLNNNINAMSAKGGELGITTDEGKYDNDRVVAYFDDLSLEAVPLESLVFSDDFENYTANPVNLGKWAKTATNFDSDLLQYQHGDVSDFSGDANYSKWVDRASEGVAEVAVIENNTGVGSGNALKIKGQIGVTNYALAKKSNLDTTEIADRQLEFSADFKAPTSGVMGEGFGVWVLADTNDATPAIRYMSNDTNLAKNDAYELKKGEFMFVGSRRLVKNDPTAKAARATYLYVFGEEVARLNPDAVYNIKVTLTPSGEGYTATVTLNGRVIALEGISLPTQAEMATYKRLYINPLSHAWTMHDSGAMSNPDGRPADMVDENGNYMMGRTIGIIDNVALVAKLIPDAPVADAIANMNALDKDWTSRGNSFMSAYAKLDGTTATVRVYSDKTSDFTPLIAVAAYDNNNRLIKAVTESTVTVSALSSATAELSGLPEAYAYVKVFVWDAFASIRPVTDSLYQEPAVAPPEEEEPEVINWISCVIRADEGILGQMHYFD